MSIANNTKQDENRKSPTKVIKTVMSVLCHMCVRNIFLVCIQAKHVQRQKLNVCVSRYLVVNIFFFFFFYSVCFALKIILFCSFLLSFLFLFFFSLSISRNHPTAFAIQLLTVRWIVYRGIVLSCTTKFYYFFSHFGRKERKKKHVKST